MKRKREYVSPHAGMLLLNVSDPILQEELPLAHTGGVSQDDVDAKAIDDVFDDEDDDREEDFLGKWQ